MTGQGIVATGPGEEWGSPSLGAGHLSGGGNVGPRTGHQPVSECGCRVSGATVRHRHGMTILGLELCFSNVLSSDCIFHCFAQGSSFKYTVIFILNVYFNSLRSLSLQLVFLSTLIFQI